MQDHQKAMLLVFLSILVITTVIGTVIVLGTFHDSFELKSHRDEPIVTNQDSPQKEDKKLNNSDQVLEVLNPNTDQVLESVNFLNTNPTMEQLNDYVLIASTGEFEKEIDL
jgi:hypothetical protein